MTSDENPSAGSEFKDRKTRLVVFGVFEILLGICCALMVALMVVGTVLSSAIGEHPAQSVNSSGVLIGLLFYALLVIWFIWMGIGSILARRWARALLLVTSWLWLIGGIIGLVFLLVFMPGMYDRMAENGQMSRQAVAIVKYVTIGFMAVLYVIIPGALVLFYGSRHVRATCERMDPRARWTDRCPLQVLAVSLMSGWWAASMAFPAFHGWVTPFFGVLLDGTAGAAVLIVSALLLLYVAWGTYRLSIRAWWYGVTLIIAWGISTGITFSRVSLVEFYAKMNFPAEQLEVMRQFVLPQTSWLVLFCVLWFVVALLYLLHVRRYFVPRTQQGAV